MANTELRMEPHSIRPGEFVFELWHAGRLIGTVTGREDGPGVRIISKFLTNSGEAIHIDAVFPPVLHVKLDP